MTAGSVQNRHILLPVVFRLPDTPDLTLEFVVDTGFTGALTLPPDAVAALRLPFLQRIPAALADGSFVDVATYSAIILWHGLEIEARVLATGNRPLLGTELLDGSELLAQFQENGLVTVEEL